MAKRWILGVVATLAVLAMAGVGFSAFTATAQINGQASAGLVGLQVLAFNSSSESPPMCYFYLTGTLDTVDAQITVTPANALQPSVTISATNLVPGDICLILAAVTNTGTTTLNVSASITAENAGICSVWPDANCYLGGLLSPYLTTYGPLAGLVDSSLAPASTYYFDFYIAFPAASTSAPASPGTFTVTFTGTAGD